MVLEKEKNMLQSLKNWLLSYDRIWFVESGVSEILSLINRSPKECFSKNLLLKEGSANNGICDKDVVGGKGGMDMPTVDVIYLDHETADSLRRFYYTYEFSDKFRIVSPNANFGTVQNYVRTGVLSSEEIAASFLK